MKTIQRTIIQVLMIILVMVTGSVLPLLQPGMAHAEAAPLAVDADRIDKFVETMREKLDVPGMAVGIVQETRPSTPRDMEFPALRVSPLQRKPLLF